MSVSDEQPRNEGPLSWRDVYTAVGESERRVIAALNAAILPLTISTSDHETRIRAIEGQGSPQARLAEASVLALGLRVTAIEAANANEKSQRRGVTEALGVGKTAVLFGIAIMSCILAVANTVARIASPS